MKKIILMMLSILMVLSFTGCQNNASEGDGVDRDAYGWEVPTINDETYDEYYSKDHVYYQRSENQLLFKDKIDGYSLECSGNGIVLQVTNGDSYQIATGDYKNYKDASLFHDGYWFYFYTTEADDIKGLVRVNLKNEEQVIFEDISESGLMNFNGYIESKTVKVLDHNVMIAICEKEDSMVIKRIYLSDMTVEEFETPLIKDTVEYEVLEQVNTKHIYCKGVDPDYYAKYLELKDNKELADSLLDKYDFENADDYLDYHLNDVCRYIIWQEYGLYAYSTFDLDVEGKETTIKQIESYIDYPVYVQGEQK